MFIRFFAISVAIALFSSSSCRSRSEIENDDFATELIGFYTEGIIDFKRGDIIVKPNANFLPGSSKVSGGSSFGHAAIVTKGFSHTDIDTLLANILIVESIASDVIPEFQVRQVPGYFEHENEAFANTRFGYKYYGNRYRLRLDISEAQVDSIIAFAMGQRGSLSCWNASKRFPDNYNVDGTKGNWADNSHWYCSLLAWQSVFYVTGIDLDVNKGYQVFPNDLINHPLFNNTATHTGRAKF